MLPLLSEVFGLRWEHIETMPFGELEAYLDRLDQIGRQRRG